MMAADRNGTSDVFVRALSTQTTSRLSLASDNSQANGASTAPDISGDGQQVVFRSQASNLVANDTNSDYDIFWKNRQTGAVERISVSNSGQQSNSIIYGPAISRDGHFALFSSVATSLIPTDTNGFQDLFLCKLIP